MTTSLSINNAVRDAYSRLLSLKTCDVKATATETCNAQFIETDCDATGLCCNSNMLQVLDCANGTDIVATLTDTTTSRTNADAALYAHVQAVLEAGGNWTPSDAMDANLQRYFSNTCGNFLNIDAQIPGRFVLNHCDNVLITMFNRSSGRIQCGISALATLFPSPVTSSATSSALLGNPLGLNKTVTTVCWAVGGFGILLLILVIVVAALLRRQRETP